MNQILRFTIPLSLLGATLPSRAETPQTVNDAVALLRRTANYSWTTTVETPGAPLAIAPIKGKAGEDGFAIQESQSGGRVLLVVTKGGRVIVKSGSEWETLAEPSSGKDAASADLVELANAKPPADELGALWPKNGDVKLEADGSYVGTLNAGDAKAIMVFLVKHRAPARGGQSPEVSNAAGTLRLWLKDGMPQKYVLTVSGSISLPFGKKEIKKVSTVNITDVGSAHLDVAGEAKAKLEVTTRPSPPT